MGKSGETARRGVGRLCVWGCSCAGWVLLEAFWALVAASWVVFEVDTLRERCLGGARRCPWGL